MTRSPPIELAIERDARELARARSHREPALVVPLESTVVELAAGATTLRLDRATFAVVPARTRHRIRASTAGSVAVVTLVIHPPARAALRREYAPFLADRDVAAATATLRAFTRTRWVDELVQRYVFEREVCDKHASAAARFLETELVKELCFLAREHAAQRTRASVVFEGDATVARAREWVEAHLFAAFDGAALARHCAASASTVLRAFRRELGVAPASYARRRRLEEALRLLESGRYAVGEVAARVGYDNASAFAAAFRGQFGLAPSRARPAAARPGERLAAHGLPPVRRPRRRN